MQLLSASLLCLLPRVVTRLVQGGLHGCHFRSLDLDASCRSLRPDAHALPPSPAQTHAASNRSRHTGSQGDGTVTARTWIRRKLPSVPAFRLPRSPGRTQRQGSRRSKVDRYPRSDGGRATGWVCLCLASRRREQRTEERRRAYVRRRDRFASSRPRFSLPTTQSYIR